MGRRSYNSLGYWDERYKSHFQKEQQQGGNAAAAAPAVSASASADAGAGGPSRKRARTAKADSASGSGSAGALSGGDDVTSDDITAEWYYSYADLEPMLNKAFRGVDRSGAVLDIGCGLSTFFIDLQKGGAQDPQEANAVAAAAAADAKTAGNKRKSSSSGSSSSARGPGFTGPCIGIDYSPSVIAHLQRTYPSAQHPQITWLCADACYLLEDPVAAPAKKKGKQAKDQEDAAAAASAAAGVAPPPLSAADRARMFAPGSYSLILDKATSDGMLCSDATARLTPLIYANVARLLAPGGLFVIASVNEPESGWFGEYVVSQLIEHGGDDTQWQIECHTPEEYKDGEEGAPNVYVIRKAVLKRARSSTIDQREPYTIKHTIY